MACDGDPIECGYEAALGIAEEEIRQLKERIRQLEDPEPVSQNLFHQFLDAFFHRTPAYCSCYHRGQREVTDRKSLVQDAPPPPPPPSDKRR